MCPQDEILELVITAMEKFHWETTKIAYFVKVRLFIIFEV